MRQVAGLMTIHCRLNQTHSVHVSVKDEHERAGLSGGRALCFSGSSFGPFSIIVSHKLQICAVSFNKRLLVNHSPAGQLSQRILTEAIHMRAHTSILRAVFFIFLVTHFCRHAYTHIKQDNTLSLFISMFLKIQLLGYILSCLLC